MKLGLIIGIIIVSVIALGFVIGAVLPETNEGCTEMGCPCEGVSGERSCNSCFFSDHIFTTGILNVVQQCRASEIITCENNAQVDSRIDVANKKCTTDWYVFGFNVKYLGTNPEESVSVSSSAPFFPTQKVLATAFNQALLPGTLEELDGCLRVNGDLIVWPYGFSLRTDKDSVIQVIDDTGQPVARVGDEVRFSGGGFSKDEIEEGMDIADILSNLSAELPNDRCGGPYWAVGEIMEVTNNESVR